MYTRKMSGWGKHLDFFILDVFILEMALFLSYGIRHDWVYRGFDTIYRNLTVYLAIASLCVGAIGRSYQGILARGVLREFRQTFLHVTAVEALMVATAFYLKEFSYSREVFLLLWGIGTVLCWAGRCLWRGVLKRLSINRRKKRQVILITVSGNAQDAVRDWEEKKALDCELCGVCLADSPQERTQEWTQERTQERTQGRTQERTAAAPEGKGEGATVGNLPIVEGISGMQGFLLRNVVDEVLVCPGAILTNEQIFELLQAGLTVHISLGGLIQPAIPTYVEEFAGDPVLTSALRVVRPWEVWVKRLMDIAGSVVGLAITGIACLFVVPAIKLADPGPAFFSQIRVGKNGRRFSIYKFRSMYKDAEERKRDLMTQNEMDGLMFKMKEDPRIIKGIGQFIRKTSIDELPQFWNVFKGDMSLVGTRPPTEDEYDSYEMRYLRRLAIKPGITGIWQTSGRNSIRDFEEVVRMDTEYISRWSLMLDIKLILKTIKVVLAGDGM